jgi:hypothetical protein
MRPRSDLVKSGRHRVGKESSVQTGITLEQLSSVQTVPHGIPFAQFESQEIMSGTVTGWVSIAQFHIQRVAVGHLGDGAQAQIRQGWNGHGFGTMPTTSSAVVVVSLKLLVNGQQVWMLS